MSGVFDEAVFKATLEALIDEAVETMREVQDIKEIELSHRTQKLDAIKRKIEYEMKAHGAKKLHGKTGHATWVTKTGASVTDIDALLKDKGIDISEKDKYTTKKEDSTYIKIVPLKGS